MKFEDRVLELIQDDEQLQAMTKSCMEFKKAFDEKVQKFYEEELGVKRGASFTIFDAILKARDK